MNNKYYLILKRIIDFLLALSGLVILSPVFFVIMCAIKLDSKGPIFFKQQRIGKGKKIFYIYKFRSMKADTPHEMPTHLLGNPDSYITKVGHFLRTTSLDELPQLVNILKGEMAVIGPRPALYNQDDLISYREIYHANDIRPGLTGLAQINGRDELPIDIKARFDGEYVNKISFFTDARIFIRTIVKVFKRDGILEGDQKTKND